MSRFFKLFTVFVTAAFTAPLAAQTSNIKTIPRPRETERSLPIVGHLAARSASNMLTARCRFRHKIRIGHFP